MAATSVALGVMLLPVLWRLARPARALAGRARFRLERRWRVRSIVILRDAATDLGDELRLGILAGRLRRLHLGRRPAPFVADGPAWALVVRGRTASDDGVHGTRILRLAGGEELRRSTRRCIVVLLPGELT